MAVVKVLKDIPEKTIRFKNVPAGDVFDMKGCAYLKLPEHKLREFGNAVSLASGSDFEFQEDALVDRIFKEVRLVP